MFNPQDSEARSNNFSLINLVPKTNKFYHVFNFISTNYGDSPRNILDALRSILDLDKGIKALMPNKNKKLSLKDIISFLKYSAPAVLYGSELTFKTKAYIKKIKEGELSERNKKEIAIREKLGWEDSDSLDYQNFDNISGPVLEWLMKVPKTVDYKILEYYDGSTLELMVPGPIPNGRSNIGIIIEYNKIKTILDATVYSFGGELEVLDSRFISANETIGNSKKILLEQSIMKDFLLSFSTKENVLNFGSELYASKRSKIKENINQYDVEALAKRIRKILKNGRRRGINIIGRQGTGKTIILKKLEELLTDIIIIKVTYDALRTTFIIRRTFEIIKTIQPALVIIEDADSCNLKEKNERVGVLINEIDDSNNNLNIVTILSINDPKMINKTIIDRPGRSDETIEIKSPRSSTEAYDVMKSKFNNLTYSYTQFKGMKFPQQSKIKKELIDKCLKHRFTQAELTSGIIEKIFIDTDNPSKMNFNEVFSKAIDDYTDSKNTLKSYKFSEELGNEGEELWGGEDCDKH